MSLDIDPPAGFTPHFRRSRVTDPWEPLFSKHDEDRFVIGFRVAEAHCNARGMLHGGVLSALSDNAMELACALVPGGATSLATIHLSVDFMASAHVGQWVEISAMAKQGGRSIKFASAEIYAEEKRIGQASALFRAIG